MKSTPKYYTVFLIAIIFALLIAVFFDNIFIKKNEHRFDKEQDSVTVSWDYVTVSWDNIYDEIYLSYFNDSFYFKKWERVKQKPDFIDFSIIKNAKKTLFYKSEIEKVEFDSILLVEKKCDYNNTYLITKDSVFIQMTYRAGCIGKIYHSKSKNNQILFSKFLCLFIEKNWSFKPEYTMGESNSSNFIDVYIKKQKSNWKIYNCKVGHYASTEMFFNLFDLYNNEMKNLKYYDSFEFCYCP
jgi:hypothetical protein